MEDRLCRWQSRITAGCRPAKIDSNDFSSISHRSRERFGPSLARQQFALALDAPSIARDRSVLLDDTMAWHKHGDRVGRDCLGHVSGVGRAEFGRERAVADRLANG